MKINRNNYELYFTDYLDNCLNQGDHADFLVFLEQNPDLKEELEEVKGLTKLQPSSLEFEHKNLLKKKEENELENPVILQQQMIASIEGELDFQKTIALKAYLKGNIAAQKDFEAFRKTKLFPNKNIIYPNKNELKRRIPVFGFYYQLSAAAAIIIALLLVYNFYKTGTKSTIRNILSNNTTKVSKDHKKPIQEHTIPGEEQKNNGQRRNVKNPISIEQQDDSLSSISPIIDKNEILDNDQEEKEVIPLLDSNKIIPSIQTPQLAMETAKEDASKGQEFLTLKQLLIKKLTGKNPARNNENQKLEAWEIADIGATQFNKISRRKLVLRKSVSPKGDDQLFHVKFGNIEFERVLASKD